MNKTLAAIACAACLQLAASQAGAVTAVTVGFAPELTNSSAGSTFAVDLLISGLDTLSLGAFDLDLQFDPVLLDLQNVAFGNQLDLGGFGSIRCSPSLSDPGCPSSSAVPGVVTLSEFSLDSTALLDAGQLSSFTLATFTFAAKSAGTGSLSVPRAILADSSGQPIPAAFQTASVAVAPAPAVPEPSSLILAACGVAVLALRARKLKRAG